MTETLARQRICYFCGCELQHKATGRARHFCSTRCRMAHRRAVRDHAERCVDAALAHLPEPPRDFGYPVRLARYAIVGDRLALVTKPPRPVTKLTGSQERL